MPDENTTDVKPTGEDTPKESSAPETTPSDGKTPDPTEQMKNLEARLEKAERNANNFQKALKEERTKRQELQTQIERRPESAQPKDDPLAEFDPAEVENFRKVAASLGFVRKDDLEQIQQTRSQQETAQKNTGIYRDFVAQHKSLFGDDSGATEEQEKAWKAFTAELSDLYDIDRNNILTSKNLDKKLAAALERVVGPERAEELRKQGRDAALAEQSRNRLLSIGSGGRASAPGTWKRKTDPNTLKSQLMGSGYSEKEAQEMVEREYEKS